VTGELRAAEHPDILQLVRAYPSGGALYPIELYVAAFDVSGLSAGIHHYHAPQHCLEGVRPGDWRDQIARHIWLGGQPLTAPTVLILTARWERPLHKYGERGYRMLLLDAGHVSQSLLLTATALGLGGCPVGGFLDDPLAESLGIDPREEAVLLCVLIGTPA
jgi:SagB-type dehydrogenase family enzyme